MRLTKHADARATRILSMASKLALVLRLNFSYFRLNSYAMMWTNSDIASKIDDGKVCKEFNCHSRRQERYIKSREKEWALYYYAL